MRKTREWTLMFYMASDNPLAISIVSQLKAIKNAGFHPEVNVITQFDPFTEGTPTHIFDVNSVNKLKYKQPNIGFGANDSEVRNLIEDKLWRDEKDQNGELIREVLQRVMNDEYEIPDYDPPRAPDLNGTSKRSNGGRRYETDPFTSLRTFLDFCYERYPARHYMLFMLGHGVVVGNDIFMLDKHAEKQSITLSEMGEALTEFTEKVEEQDGTLELVSFHSCSVSSLEIAYELKGTANYMLASEGPTFVGSWPYRQILIRIFNEVESKTKDIKQLMLDIFQRCHDNSVDYLLAGYSSQLTLCELKKVSELNEPLERLSNALIEGLLKDAASTFVILHSHWKAQSFFQDMYTDLYDFCYCIVDRFNRIQEGNKENNDNPISPQLTELKDACLELMVHLAKPKFTNAPEEDVDPLVVTSQLAGPAYQYSQGVSVYFPWTRPSEDSHIIQQYQDYKIHREFHPKLNTESTPPRNEESNKTDRKSWLDFLHVYFEQTQRFPSKTEQLWEQSKFGIEPVLSPEQQLRDDIESLIYNGEGPLGGFSLAKSDPRDKTGEECECPSFKNYPRDTRSRGERRKRAQAMPKSLIGELKRRAVRV